MTVLGQSFDHQLNNLRDVFSRFRKYNLKLKPRKCTLFRTEVKVLGKMVTRDGISLDPNKVEAVKNWPIYKSVTEVESFLGFTNYHTSHIIRKWQIHCTNLQVRNLEGTDSSG